MEQRAMGAVDGNTTRGGRGRDADAAHEGEEARWSYVRLETNGHDDEAIPAWTTVAVARRPRHVAALDGRATWDAATVG